ncbi:MAG: putative acetyltransferase [Symbiobacteriaceae bacterium]|jgi:putative acetyltransferase|nr:putative acetyltransferase [Symbiobacteriaceae bacterium]
MSDVKIRAVSPDDAEAITELCMQPNVVWGTLQLPAQTADGWRKRLAANDPNTSYTLCAEVDGKPVGMIGLNWTTRPRVRHVAHVGMMVHDAYQGRGIGRALMQAAVDAADNWLGLIRLELEVWPDNERAVKLYRSFGFAEEGRKRLNAFRDGKYVDSLAMGRIRPGFAE